MTGQSTDRQATIITAVVHSQQQVWFGAVPASTRYPEVVEDTDHQSKPDCVFVECLDGSFRLWETSILTDLGSFLFGTLSPWCDGRVKRREWEASRSRGACGIRKAHAVRWECADLNGVDSAESGRTTRGLSHERGYCCHAPEPVDAAISRCRGDHSPQSALALADIGCRNAWVFRRMAARGVFVGNGDGRLDVVIADGENRNARIVWLEAPPDPKTERWITHLLPTCHQLVGAEVVDAALCPTAELVT